LRPSGKRIIILGAGFGGLTAANVLVKALPPENEIVVIDKKNYFLMGVVNLWILNGNRKLEESKLSLDRLRSKGIKFLNEDIAQIDLYKKIVRTRSGNEIEYDYLIIALGVDFDLERISGFLQEGGFNLYDAEQIPKLREEILLLQNGRIAICITDIPYKCPPAPYEASLIIDDILTKNRSRENIDIDVYAPTPIALPIAGSKISQMVVELLNSHNVNFYPLHKLKAALNKGQVEFENGNSITCDILIGVPPHKIPAIVANSSGLIKEGQNWINVDRFTLRTSYENVFAIGDITEIKVSQNAAIPKAGIFAEAEAKAVAQQIISEVTQDDTNRAQNSRFDGKGYCFMEVGSKKAGYLIADFYNKDGPIVELQSPSEQSYEDKLEFERKRVSTWL
jgi:sulfide:quinone oxidoreductase